MPSRADDWLLQAVRDLYIGPRYPNSDPEGAPGDFYTAAEAQRAIAAAERVIEHCQRHLVR